MTRTSQGRRAGLGLLLALLLLGAGAAITRGDTTVHTSTSRAEVDAHVDSSRPARSFEGVTRLKVRGASPEVRTYLRFDVAGVQGTVRRALLRVRMANGGDRGFDVRGVADSTWPEDIDFRSAPDPSSAVTASSGPAPGGTWVTVDVTPLVSGNGRVSMALTRSAAAGSGDDRALTIYSRESGSGAAAAQLVVESGDPLPPADTTPPQVSLTQPEDGATVYGVVPVTAGATDDDGIASVDFRVDGRSIGTDGTAPYGVDWDTAAVDVGPRTIRAVATDAAGNTTTSSPRGVTVGRPPGQDGDPPQTTIERGPAHTYRSGIVSLEFSSDEEGGTFECKLARAAFAPCTSGQTFHVANGEHRFQVRARDAAGNPDPTPASRRWWSDATLQNGTFEAPSAGWTEYGFAVPGWQGSGANVTILDGGMLGRKARVEVLPDRTSYSMYDRPRSVDATVAGRTYTATASVRSDVPGRQLCLQVIERGADATARTGSARRCLIATTAWQSFPEVTYTARGGDNLYVSIGQDSAAQPGDSFEVDGAQLSDGGPLSVAAPRDPGGAPRLLAFGDIAFCDSSGDEAVSRLVDTLPGTIAMVGDLEQNDGSAGEFAGCFAPTWDRHLWRTRPAVGDHEYKQPGAIPYWDALGGLAGERGKGWYSYDLADWHIVVLNSNCTEVGGCGPGSEQYEWLQQDLAANAGSCLGAYFHHPRFSSGSVHGGIERVQPFWDVLYRYSAEWVLGGNDANYQRFAPQTPWGERDDVRGIRQFVVGTGGTMHYPNGPALPNTEVQHSGTFGALELTLGSSSYDWRFVPQEGRTFTDTGSKGCAPVPPPDTTPPAVELTAPAAGATLTGTATMAATATDDDRIDQVEFRAGDLVLGVDRSAPYSAEVDTTMLPAGRHTLAAVARDLSGNEGTSAPVEVTVTAPDPLPQNLVTNPSLESGISGWGRFRAELSRVTGGAVGSYALRADYIGAGDTFSAVTTPVAATTAGATYRATAWIRSERPGNRVCWRFRERDASGQVLGSADTCLTLSSSWQVIPELRYTTVGGGKLDIYAHQPGPAAGASFELDGVRVVAG